MTALNLITVTSFDVQDSGLFFNQKHQTFDDDLLSLLNLLNGIEPQDVSAAFFA